MQIVPARCIRLRDCGATIRSSEIAVATKNEALARISSAPP